MIHLTYKQPVVALCGAHIVNNPLVIDLAVPRGDAVTPEYDRAVAETLCPHCAEARAAGRYCEVGHVWHVDPMHGESCQCRQMAILRDGDNDTLTVVTVEQTVGGDNG